jgi:integrase
MDAKKPTVRPGTFRGGYVVMLNHLRKSPFTQTIPDVDQTGFAQGLADWAIASRLVQLKESPFVGSALRSVSRKGCRSEREIDPFTLKQRNVIIEHYYTHPKYSHYALFVGFCFLVGCRPSEAIALQNNNISSDLKQVTFSHAVVSGRGGDGELKA